MFENLKALLIKETNEQKADKRQYIEEGFHYNRDAGLKRYSTDAKWAAYQAGELTREKAVEIAVQRAWRGIEKEHREKLQDLESAEAVPDAESVSIRVTWKRSRTWGYNPHAVVIVNGVNRYEGKASGAGYDKLSTAIAEALNQSAVIRRALYQAKEKALQEGKNGRSNRECIAYGAGYGVLPYFEGGVGLSSTECVFNACGLKMKIRDERGGIVGIYFFERG